MKLVTPYRHATIADDFDVIVIGSGAGGLGVATLLAKLAHRRVLVLERHYTVGGFTHTFTRPGYEWDVGLHYVGRVHDPASVERRWLDYLTDGRLQWADMGDVYDRFLFGDDMYAFPSTRGHWRDALQQRFPLDAPAIDTYLGETAAATKWMTLFFTEQVLPPSLRSLVGSLLRAPFLRRATRTTGDLLRGITRNEKLVGVLTGQWGDYGLPPAQSSFAIHATIVEHYINGAAYPVGGASQFAAAVLPTIVREGGHVVSAADVRRILVVNGEARGVRLADGREFHARTVISDAGARTTYEALFEGEPATLPLLYQIRGLLPSPGHLCLYVGLRGTSEEVGLPRANLWGVSLVRPRRQLESVCRESGRADVAVPVVPVGEGPDRRVALSWAFDGGGHHVCPVRVVRQVGTDGVDEARR
jgi:all-trans-retinol 13,14-reductase